MEDIASDNGIWHGQVEKLEKQLASVKEVMDAELEAKAAEAEQLRGKVAELRSATSHTVADSEEKIMALQVHAYHCCCPLSFMCICHSSTFPFSHMTTDFPRAVLVKHYHCIAAGSFVMSAISLGELYLTSGFENVFSGQGEFEQLFDAVCCRADAESIVCFPTGTSRGADACE